MLSSVTSGVSAEEEDPASRSSSPSSSNQTQDGSRMAQGAFGNNPAFEEQKQRLAERVASNEGLMTGDYEHKTRVVERIGGGSFGEVYLGEIVETKQRVAVKIEPAACMIQSLLHEGRIYRKLRDCSGIPQVHWYGLHGRDFTALVMDLLGSTLYERWVECGHRFSLKTVLMLADQMLDIMAHVHSRNFVHRDISPNNFMFGTGPEKSLQLYLIDFGHTKELNPLHVIPARRQRFGFTQPMVGTPRFASVFSHMGLEPSFRDDMDSLAYIWIYLLKGHLPWQGIKVKTQQNKLELIAQTKFRLPVEELCEGLPEEFASYLHYVRNLRHMEMPDHTMIRQFFRDLAEREGIEYDSKFDWVPNETTECGVDEGNMPSEMSLSSSSSSIDSRLHTSSSGSELITDSGKSNTTAVSN